MHLYRGGTHAERRHARAELRPFGRSIQHLPVTVASGPTLSAQSYAHVRPPVVLYVERAALDEAGQLLVHGWAVSLTAMVAVQVFLDEARIGAAQLGGQRDDVGSAFPAYQNAQLSGFTLSQRIDATPANVSTVRVQAISMNGFLHEAVLPVERVHVLAPSAPLEAAPSEPMPPILPMLQQPTYRLVTGFSIDRTYRRLPRRRRHRRLPRPAPGHPLLLR